MTATKWDKRFLELAQLTAGWSKDPRRQIGCVIVDEDKNVLSGGFNGFPRGVKDDERLADRELKNRIIVHAEANAVATAARNGHSIKGATAYVTWHPCGQCTGLLIQAGVKRIVFSGDTDDPNWIESFDLGRELCEETGTVLERLKPEDL
jgi:dCMP deaminase